MYKSVLTKHRTFVFVGVFVCVCMREADVFSNVLGTAQFCFAPHFEACLIGHKTFSAFYRSGKMTLSESK